MKKIFLLFLVLFLLVSCSNKTVDLKSKLITEKTTQYFLSDALPKEDIDNILKAGMNATSSRNKQDWHFSAVTNKELLLEFRNKMFEEVMPSLKNQNNPKAQIGDSPLAIVVSCGDNGEYDAGLASQNMFDYAVLLGYGVKIVVAPCKMLDDNYKEKLNIPNNMHACAVLLIGKVKNLNNVDTVSSASTRKPMNEVVSFN